MHLQLGHVLAGLAVRPRKPQHQRLVDHVAGSAGSRRRANVARRGSGTRPIRSSSGSIVAAGPEIRMTAIAAGGRPDERAKIVSRLLAQWRPRNQARTALVGSCRHLGQATQSANGERFSAGSWSRRNSRHDFASVPAVRYPMSNGTRPEAPCQPLRAHALRPRKPPRPRDQPLSAAAQIQSGRLVALGTGRARRSQAQQQADPALGRLCGLPLVPCHGA